MHNPIPENLKRHPELREILEHPLFLSMSRHRHHGTVSCLAHTLQVAGMTYSLARKRGLDHISATRGALLHDFYLYDWHTDSPGLHGFKHPRIALRNARQHFSLNSIEENIILRHMWPLTLTPPRYRESLLVCLVDKLAAVTDYTSLAGKKRKPAGIAAHTA
jgi:uncharacterized protein